MLGPQNLLWVKNVKRDRGNAWAYMEYGAGDVFDLHFPNNAVWFPTNYEKAQVGDCILIYQTYNGDTNQAAGTYLTHIVTPIDSTVQRVFHASHPYKRAVCVVAKAERGILKPEHWNFYKPNRGAICDITTLELEDGTNPGIQVTQTTFWNLFTDVDPNIDLLINELNNLEGEDEETASVEEGRERQLLKLHKIRERNSAIIREKKRIALEADNLRCEACSFDFAAYYPTLGDGFIECHHKVPIAQGVRITRVEDLALVCANCHRMLHRKTANGDYLTLEQLATLIQQH